MKIINVIKGEWKIPEEHCLSKDKKRLTIKSAWSSEVQHLDKACWQTSIQQWFRSKDRGDKPYIPEGFVELDGERYILKIKNG